MKQFTIAVTLIATLTSANVFASTGSKPVPPASPFAAEKSGFPTTSNSTGSKPVPPKSDGFKLEPVITASSTGSKPVPPKGDIVAKDSGTSTLSNLISKYLGF